MKSILYLLFLPLFFTSILDGCNKRDFPVEFEANDIDHFWEAYDKIVDTEDSLLQKQYLRELYLDKGTAGLNDLVKARGYSEEEYLEGILAHPEFWKSIKSNTINTPDYQKEITSDIHKLKSVYPELGPAKIYFSVGAFRTNGTAVGKNVIIGSEQALADKHTAIDEFPEARQTFYKNYRPLENLALLCTHEYIHTQQNELVHNLLSKCLYEGVAEFISCKATGKTSTSPAITYGKANEEIVVEKFVEDLYLMSNDYNWLWGVNRNELKIRDLGYYIGYEICERYYNQSDDKAKAIKELIEIDYKNESQVEMPRSSYPNPSSSSIMNMKAKDQLSQKSKSFRMALKMSMPIPKVSQYFFLKH